MAIKIQVKPAEPGYNLGASKFFGTPTIPMAWQEDFFEDEIFFCQIRLADIAALDPENLLPHTGYLYVFLRTAFGEYDIQANVRYYDGEPDLAIDDFNEPVEGYEDMTDAWLMEFSPAESDAVCTRLFGVPSDWNYADVPPKLLLQYDPLDNEMGFLDYLDGIAYLFFGEDRADFSAVKWHGEFS